MAEPTHERWMASALRLARRGQGRVEPNPMVGAVLVRDGRLIGRGFHQSYGGPHAEPNALADCLRRGHDPRGATLYVTLEPCRHQGKTPPCTQAVIDAGVAEVYAATEDPFPENNGRGLQALREAGLTVHVGLLADRAAELIAPFHKRVTRRLPWVIAKWAQSLDGRIAAATGQSRWISNQRSRALAHRLRARVDAVMVGVGTVTSDDPRLNARDVPVKRRALAVVVDPRLRTPPGAALFDGGEAVVACDRAAVQTEQAEMLRRAGATLAPLPRLADGSLSLQPLLAMLARDRAATNVLVEGGGRLLGSLFAQGLVDQVIAFVAPRVVGDAGAVPAVAGLHPPDIASAVSLRLERATRLDGDMMLDYRVGGAATLR